MPALTPSALKAFVLPKKAVCMLAILLDVRNREREAVWWRVEAPGRALCGLVAPWILRSAAVNRARGELLPHRTHEISVIRVAFTRYPACMNDGICTVHHCRPYKAFWKREGGQDRWCRGS